MDSIPDPEGASSAVERQPSGDGGPGNSFAASTGDAAELDSPDTGFLARGLYAQAIIWFTVLFVLVMTALIWYRWSSVSLPTSNIVPFGDESVEGAEVTVVGNGETIGSVHLEKKSSYAGTIWLVPGLYNLTVKLNDRVVEQAEVVVKPMHSVSVFVSLKPRGGAVTAPATNPATAPSPPPRPAVTGPAASAPPTATMIAAGSALLTATQNAT